LTLAVLKRRTPRLASVLVALRALPTGWRKRGMREARDYVRHAYEIGDTVPTHDLTMGLALRATLEGRYTVVAEIGAAWGGRIATLKRLVPGIEAHALDIGEAYRTPFERYGVRFRPLDDAALAALPPGSLILSRGTLCYLDARAIDSFVARAAERGHDLVVVEPMTLFDLPETVARGGASWYHPYPSLLSRHGFAGHPGRADGAKHNDSLAMLECWYTAWSRAPAKAR
jgi:hypothetical protein